MSNSPDTPESGDIPASTRGPLALILGTLRVPVHVAITRLNQIVATGTLSPQQLQHHNEALRALQQISRTVEQYAPPSDARSQSRRNAAGDRWDAGEQPDALDDRFQDARVPLDDRPGRDGQP